MAANVDRNMKILTLLMDDADRECLLSEPEAPQFEQDMTFGNV